MSRGPLPVFSVFRDGKEIDLETLDHGSLRFVAQNAYEFSLRSLESASRLLAAIYGKRRERFMCSAAVPEPELLSDLDALAAMLASDPLAIEHLLAQTCARLNEGALLLLEHSLSLHPRRVATLGAEPFLPHAGARR